MRLLMITPGTRGDVAPMAGLGQRLSAYGIDVAIASDGAYRELVTPSGCAFRELPGDMGAMVKPAAPGTKTTAKDLRHYLDELRSYFDQAATGTLQAAEHGVDMIFANSVAPFAYDIAEALGVPAIGAHLQPTEPSGDYAPMALGTARSFGSFGNKALHRLFTASKSPYDAPTARIRAELGLPKRSRAVSDRLRRKTSQPILNGFSSAVVPRSAGWHENVINCGYWWPTFDPSWTASKALRDFLSAGEPPVFLGFGSTDALGPDFLLDVAQRTGRRTIIQGAGEINEPNVLGIDEVPHQWLFPQVAAVVHHAGAGTTAAGLRAGVPTVPVPIFTDQPFWAERIHSLGAAVAPLPYKKLSTESLASAIDEAVTNPRYTQGATLISAKLAAENDSALTVARFLECY
ncbi:glycosyltransferase [Glutamicibacter sp. JC586]|uniref:glycosyltransferase n=1 Tax=Glutamicibacter sp. JC586 TaxID=2590552 RepID=UPI00135C1092|nr:glycosyltransferase [Glutamicibacter sp. JC586]